MSGTLYGNPRKLIQWILYFKTVLGNVIALKISVLCNIINLINQITTNLVSGVQR